MIWWLKTRLVHTVLACGVAAFGLLTFLFQDGTVVLPAISVTAGNTVLLAGFTPLLVVGALVQSLDSRLTTAEVTGTRPVAWLDTGLVVVTMITVAALTAVGGFLLDSPAVVAAGRNSLFLTGLALCARGWTGRSSIVFPTAWIFLVVLVGHRTADDFFPWAVTGLALGSSTAAVAAGASLLLGISLNHHMTTRQGSRP
ncbi:hypothetical protein [Streptomyces xylophagus]|uniref:hypothetical protein n=1 Tax=Streptomyces xylophagus TaxID=285514 RepID=UPI00068FF2B8|nr:hypothetical protein [Streptomyces xylophagus]